MGKTYRIFIVLFLSAFARNVHSQCCGNPAMNLLAHLNADFSDTFTVTPPGFTNDATYVTFPTGPGTYLIITYRQPGSCMQYDHTGGGTYLWYDTPFYAAPWSPGIAWMPLDTAKPPGSQDLIDVQPNKKYMFSAWVRDIGRLGCDPFGAPVAALQINGTVLSTLSLTTAADSCCPEWQQLCAEWDSGTNTTAQLKILSLDSYGFTDLGIDDIFFGEKASMDLWQDVDVCANTIPGINLSFPPGFSNFAWSTGDTTAAITITAPGTYFGTGTAGCGTLSDTVAITINPSPDPPLVDDTSICVGSAPLTLSAAGTNVQWFDCPAAGCAALSTPVIYTDFPLSATFYVTQTLNGCESEPAIVTAKVISKPEFSMEDLIEICEEDVLRLGPSNDEWSYLWNDTAEEGSPRLIGQEGRYILSAQNSCGIKTDTAYVSLRECNCTVYLPNAFSPDNNGLNDSYKPVCDCSFSSYSLNIFNRWGECIFTSQNPEDGWDGSVNGNIAQEGVYVARIFYTSKEIGNQNTKTRYTSVYLTR